METTQEAVHRLTYLANLPTFDEWRDRVNATPVPSGYRFGQHIFNSAPNHITRFVVGKPNLDPFYFDADMDGTWIINNFLIFCELVWDVLDEEELNTAKDMVLAEPNARRR